MVYVRTISSADRIKFEMSMIDDNEIMRKKASGAGEGAPDCAVRLQREW